MNDAPLLKDPIKQFEDWLEKATKKEINDPGAMALATSTPDGKPSVRMVLLKSVNDQGFKFHSNSGSQKGQEIENNKQASLCFYWKSLRKQIRVEGIIEIIKDEEADKYFKTRPYNRKIGAWASAQSRELDSRKTLEDKIQELETQYPEGVDIPRPSDWIGYRLVPNIIEFWMDNPDRLHDRFVYTKNASGHWDIKRIYP